MTSRPSSAVDGKLNETQIINGKEVSYADFQAAMAVMRPHLDSALTNLQVVYKRSRDTAEKATREPTEDIVMPLTEVKPERLKEKLRTLFGLNKIER